MLQQRYFKGLFTWVKNKKTTSPLMLILIIGHYLITFIIYHWSVLPVFVKWLLEQQYQYNNTSYFLLPLRYNFQPNAIKHPQGKLPRIKPHDMDIMCFVSTEPVAFYHIVGLQVNDDESLLIWGQSMLLRSHFLFITRSAIGAWSDCSLVLPLLRFHRWSAAR